MSLLINRSMLSGVCALSGLLCLFTTETLAFSFSEPEVLKLDWATRSLNVGDLNRDGLNDLALINQDTAQIEILYQRSAHGSAVSGKKQLSRNRWNPVLEDARYDSEGISVGFPVFDLSVGDVNGDGLGDLAYTSKEVPLTIRYQSESGSWTELHEFDNFKALGWTNTVKIADINGDGRAELVVIAADALRVFEHDAKGRPEEPKVYYLTGENPYNLILEDVNEDALLDVLYITSNGKQSLALREQLPGGGFGPERRFVFARPVRGITALARQKDEAAHFCSVDARSGSLEFFRLKSDVHQGGVDESARQPEIYPIFKKGRLPASYAMGDVNGDGRDDLLVANPSGAEVVLFLKEERGFLAPKEFPSFSAISAMTCGRFFKDSQERLVMVSVAEKTMGLSFQDAGGRLSFPRELLVGSGDPLVCEAVDLDRDGYDELALITEDKGKYQLLLARPVSRKKVNSEWEVLTQLSLDQVKRKPSGILAVDIFRSGRNGLMVFVPREAPLFFAATEDAPFELTEVAENSTIRQSLLKDVKRSQVSVFDVDGDRSSELVVGREGYARALAVVDNDLEMVDQFNARRGEDMVSAVVPLIDEGGVERLMFYVADPGEFQFLQRDTDGVFRYQHTDKTGRMDLIEWAEVELDGHGSEFIFAGESQFWYLPEQVGAWSRVVEDSYETNVEDVRYTHIEGADFDGDGALDLIAVDGTNHVVEILSQSSEGWESRMYWEIFEQNMHYQGRTGGNVEPRQVLVADLTGDGLIEFAFLIHDRILFYPQE
jgi:hypothetical protein